MSDDFDDSGRQQPPPPPPPGSRGGQRPRPNGTDPNPQPGGYEQADHQESQAWQHQGGWGTERPRGTQPASVGVRFLAYLVDVIIVGIVSGIIGTIIALPFAAGGADSALTFFTGNGLGFGYVVGLLGAGLQLAYFALLEGRNGQTLGKRLLSIRAVRADLSPLNTGDALKRRLPFVIGSFLPFLGSWIDLAIAIAIVVTASSDQPWHQGLHDKWAGTVVVQT